MVTQELLSYIKVQLGQGVATDAISTALVSQGWSADDVASALATLKPTPVATPVFTPVEAPISNPVSAPVSTPVSKPVFASFTPPASSVSNSYSSPATTSSVPRKSSLVPFLMGAFVATAIIAVLGYFFVYPKLVTEPSLLIEASDPVQTEPVESLPEQAPVSAAASTSTLVLVPGGEVPDSEKQLIIAAILRTKEVFASNDVARVRAYLTLTLPEGSEDRAELASTSDEELLETAGFVSALSQGLTASALSSTTTLWTVEAPTRVKVKIVDGAYSNETSANKFDGVWY